MDESLRGHGRRLLGLLCALMALTVIHSSPMDAGARPRSVSPPRSAVPPPTSRPLALVYRGPAGCPGCSEAVAAVLQQSSWNFDVEYVGPNETLQLSAATLSRATLYAQPGGNQSLQHAWNQVKNNATDIQNFVRSGGRYLGFCMGGYLAGRTPGFSILPGDTNEYTHTSGATVTNPQAAVTQIRWRGSLNWMYVQDPPYFILDPGAQGVTVLANYLNGPIAAMVSSYGNGKVGVTGPHPEATQSWYTSSNLTDPDGLDAAQGLDLINAVMQ